MVTAMVIIFLAITAKAIHTVISLERCAECGKKSDQLVSIPGIYDKLFCTECEYRLNK